MKPKPTDKCSWCRKFRFEVMAKKSIKDQADIFALLKTEGPHNQRDIELALGISAHRVRKAVKELAEANAIVLADTSGNQKQWKVRPPCPKCKMMWDGIRRDEDEVAKMKKHPKAYGKTIARLEADLQRRYAIVRECRQKNHPHDQW